MTADLDVCVWSLYVTMPACTVKHFHDIILHFHVEVCQSNGIHWLLLLIDITQRTYANKIRIKEYI